MERCFRIAVLLLLAVADAHSQTHANEPVAKWREDLEFARRELPRVHKNLFHTISKEEFDRSLSSLSERLPVLDDDQIIVELGRIVARIGDGHTHINFSRPSFGFHALPLRVYRFADGIFIRSATPERQRILGARLLRIGALPAEEAWKRVEEVTPRDNESGLKMMTAVHMAIPEILHALGITTSKVRVPLRVETRGKELEVELAPVEQSALLRGDLLDARNPAAPEPLHTRDRDKNFWFEYLEGPKVLYVKYNAVYWQKDANGDYTSPVEFFDTVFRFADAHPVDKLIIDVRNNGGGNNTLNLPIIHGIIKRDAINTRGKLFTIIGRETFSAAQNFINLMEKHTRTIFAGEPSGARPNHYGDPAPVTLPNSKAEIRVSTLWWQDAHPADDRPAIVPQLFSEPTFDEYRRGLDPVLDAVLRYRPLTELLRDALVEGGDRAAEVYARFKGDPVNRYANTAAELNELGRDLIEKKRIADSITVLSLNIQAYSESATAHHLLADALLASGKRAAAIGALETAVRLEPRNPYHREVLEKLRATPPSQ